MIQKKEIWEIVRELQQHQDDTEVELGEIRATLIVNFGEEGKYEKNIVHHKDKTISMLMKVLDYFHNLTKKPI